MPCHPAIAIVGPTASGKSRLGLELAAMFQGEIVSCDALQVYRGMNIGTAKPSADERRRVPHHLIDLRDPGEDFSAGDYQRQGRQALLEIRGRGRLPIVVGGTGFYLRSLIEGLFEGPQRSEPLRSRMRRIMLKRGSRTLHRALQRVDPRAAGRIAPADGARILRAYEVYLQTGKPMSWWQDQPGERLEGFRWLKLGIAWPRRALYGRIDRRVEAMIEQGFVEEVRSLVRLFPPTCHAFKAIGYRQIAEALAGRCSLEQAVEGIQRQSRRYAKRQLTWFRSDPEIHWLEATEGGPLPVDAAAALVGPFLDLPV